MTRTWPRPWTWARTARSTALGLRKARQLRVRLPLTSLVIAHPEATSLAPFTDLIADEVNVKTVELSREVASLGTFELAVNPRVLGPRSAPGAAGHPGGQGGRVVAVRGPRHRGRDRPGPRRVRAAAGRRGCRARLPPCRVTRA